MDIKKFWSTFRQQVVPLDNPTKHIAPGGKLVSGDVAVFEDKAANAVLLDAEAQLRSGYPTIATSSLVTSRKKRVGILEESDNHTDMKFFSELVKPVTYRWKFEKDKIKTLAPSKHGFHQRSTSPTFQRLVNAHEKLQHLVHESENESGEKASNGPDFYETQSPVAPTALRPQLRKIKSEPQSTRTYVSASSLPATRSNYVAGRFDIRPEIRTIEPARKETEDSFVVEEDDDDEDECTCTHTPSAKSSSPTPSVPIQSTIKKPQQEFKVDFRKTDSHTELHLFLPQIQDTPSRGATPDTPTRKSVLKLPRIGDVSGTKSTEDDKSKLKKRQKNCDVVINKRKKKPPTRVKSGKEDKEIRDRLNDVPTLISLENERDYHPASMCMFEDCQYHQHRKSNSIRQA